MGPLRVLLVDDAGGVRRTLARLLDAQGHRVTTARALDEARRILGEQSFDMLISDLILPDGSGLELTRAWTGPRVWMSGYADAITQQELRGESAPFLAKPFEASELLAAIAEALDGWPAPDGAYSKLSV